MGLLLLVLLLALILGGLGFAVHVLWWVALIVLAIWLIRPRRPVQPTRPVNRYRTVTGFGGGFRARRDL